MKDICFMYFKGDYLRVVSPVTEDGNRPKIDPETGMPVYKETALPVSARRALERQNKRLPNHLRKKIELVSSGEQVKEAPAERKKTGPKSKNANVN